ncbi:hypothetical protein [Roseobacter sp.]|uniref:hypothetical protein n=1 Tax=Roseobacter sp. TaxID=1907202 RepID=UPI002966E2EA|nr:hypothetical protein [Roseobacter sp.]MDW3181308.1 hypothetical protein [Roseobacter sp.]
MTVAFERRIERLVGRWKYLHKANLDSHLNAYRNARNLDVAISWASSARQDGKSDKRNSHQRRLPKAAPPEINTKLSASITKIRSAKKFDQLYQVVQSSIQSVFGVGLLMVYDTSLRIGAHLKVEPSKVYLQSGALEGAKEYFRLAGLAQNLYPGGALEIQAFPLLKFELSASEIENFLCTMRRSMNPIIPISQSSVF